MRLQRDLLVKLMAMVVLESVHCPTRVLVTVNERFTNVLTVYGNKKARFVGAFLFRCSKCELCLDQELVI